MTKLFHRIAVTSVALSFLSGCESKLGKIEAPIVTNVKATPVDESQPMIAHPEYENWSRFPVKSFIVRKRLVTNANGEVTVITKMWLEGKTEKEVRIGSQVTVKRPDEAALNNPADFVSYPAEFRLPKGMEKERFYLPSLKAEKRDDETQTIGERQIRAEVYEWEEMNEAGPMTVKLWRSLEVPGKIIHQEMVTKSSNTKISEQVIEMDLSGETNNK